MNARRNIAALAAILIYVSMAAQANILSIDAGTKLIKNCPFELNDPLAGWDRYGTGAPNKSLQK